MKEPRISVVASEELLEALIAAAKALRASRKKEQLSPGVLNALIVQVSTARGTYEHVLRTQADAARHAREEAKREEDRAAQAADDAHKAL